MTTNHGFKIEFLLKTRIKGIFFTPDKPRGIDFIPSIESELRFFLGPIDPEGDACGNRKGLLCQTRETYVVTKDQSFFVDSYNKSGIMTRVADDISLPYKPKDKILIDENGLCSKGFRPRRYLCPSDIRKAIEDAECKLASKTDSFLKLLRWRQGIDAPDSIIESQTLYWGIGEGQCYLVPFSGKETDTVIVQSMLGIRWDTSDINNLQELWASNEIAEPLGHTLVREAAAIASESPRSAILIMVAGLETAVKMHISSVAPDTDWLMEKSPSPPIGKMLREYIPIIHGKRGVKLDYWDKVKPFIKNVEKLFDIRNKVAHTGKIPEDFGSIQDALELVSDFLYLIDDLTGHTWSKSFASYKFRKALDWHIPDNNNRLMIHISQAL